MLCGSGFSSSSGTCGDAAVHASTFVAAVALGVDLPRRLMRYDRSETGAELLARCYRAPVHTGVPVVDTDSRLCPGNVLEAVGGAGCGKTELLIQAAVTCILPKRQDGVVYGGHGGAPAPLRTRRSLSLRPRAPRRLSIPGPGR